jgi:sulfonate transport system substrate-binding protein
MNPVATEDPVLHEPRQPLSHALRDLAVSLIVVAAVALITGFVAS